MQKLWNRLKNSVKGCKMPWMKNHEITKPREIKPMDWHPLDERIFVPSTGTFLLPLLAALLLIMLSGCSKAVSVQPTPVPPANLSTTCRLLDNPPVPLIDPERAIWESQLIAKYMECSTKHRLTIDAWLAAVKTE